MRYAVGIEKAESDYWANVPDLPGCATTGVMVGEVEQLVRKSSRFASRAQAKMASQFLSPVARWNTFESLRSMRGAQWLK